MADVRVRMLLAAAAAMFAGQVAGMPAGTPFGAGHPIPTSRNGQRKVKRAAAAKRRKTRGRKSAR